MNDGVASGSGDDRHAGEGQGEGAAGGNMAPPQFLMGSGTFFKDRRVFICPLAALACFATPGPRDCED